MIFFLRFTHKAFCSLILILFLYCTKFIKKKPKMKTRRDVIIMNASVFEMTEFWTQHNLTFASTYLVDEFAFFSFYFENIPKEVKKSLFYRIMSKRNRNVNKFAQRKRERREQVRKHCKPIYRCSMFVCFFLYIFLQFSGEKPSRKAYRWHSKELRRDSSGKCCFWTIL